MFVFIIAVPNIHLCITFQTSTYNVETIFSFTRFANIDLFPPPFLFSCISRLYYLKTTAVKDFIVWNL